MNPTGWPEYQVKARTVGAPSGVPGTPPAADGCRPARVHRIASPARGFKLPGCLKGRHGEVKTHFCQTLIGFGLRGRAERPSVGSLIRAHVVVEDPVSGVSVKVAGEVTSPTLEAASDLDT